jgi:hypothetical protein
MVPSGLYELWPAVAAGAMVETPRAEVWRGELADDGNTITVPALEEGNYLVAPKAIEMFRWRTDEKQPVRRSWRDANVRVPHLKTRRTRVTDSQRSFRDAYPRGLDSSRCCVKEPAGAHHCNQDTHDTPLGTDTHPDAKYSIRQVRSRCEWKVGQLGEVSAQIIARELPLEWLS